jgi:hypothetical protein
VDEIPKADIARYRKSVEPILAKSCVACHGPKKAKGGFRIDQLNPDMLAGPDAERWRDVHGVLSKSEMPPEDEPAYALSEIDRGLVTEWLGGELNKASLTRRNSSEHSSFRRLTKYEYDHALQDILGLSYPLAGKLPPETTTEDGFQNSSELLQITGPACHVPGDRPEGAETGHRQRRAPQSCHLFHLDAGGDGQGPEKGQDFRTRGGEYSQGQKPEAPA